VTFCPQSASPTSGIMYVTPLYEIISEMLWTSDQKLDGFIAGYRKPFVRKTTTFFF
jgi:hypothetical protein